MKTVWSEIRFVGTHESLPADWGDNALGPRLVVNGVEFQNKYNWYVGTGYHEFEIVGLSFDPPQNVILPQIVEYELTWPDGTNSTTYTHSQYFSREVPDDFVIPDNFLTEHDGKCLDPGEVDLFNDVIGHMEALAAETAFTQAAEEGAAALDTLSAALEAAVDYREVYGAISGGNVVAGAAGVVALGLAGVAPPAAIAISGVAGLWTLGSQWYLRATNSGSTSAIDAAIGEMNTTFSKIAYR